MERTITSGKRKTAIARAIITEGNGKVTINGKDYKNLEFFNRLRIEEPIRIAQQVLENTNFNAEILTRGGGNKSQTEAARLALARGIVAFSKSKPLREAYLAYDRNMLVADIRRKETYKPGDSKARRKRQKSYR